tara:strand:- start:927 stop:1784 length:858 start_codon:yes stop_codon:yes gene_type:complete
MKHFVFISDMFADTYRGGAELTTDAIMRGAHIDSNIAIGKIPSHAVTVQQIEKGKDVHWIVCNFSALNSDVKIKMCKESVYSIIEYDYKFCSFRSVEKHKAITKSECDCLNDFEGKLNMAFYGYAQKIWFMSEGQKNIFIKYMPHLKNNNLEVLSSIFYPGDLRFMSSIKDNEKENPYIILKSSSWIKGTQSCIEYAKENNLDYELVENLSYHELLIKMSTAKGLIFRPLGNDTCPRIVIEAKLLGCDLKINDFVQHKDEEWFSSQQSCYDYLFNRVDKFWKHYE